MGPGNRSAPKDKENTLKIKVILAALLLMVLPALTEPQNGSIITITAGTAIRLTSVRTMASSMLIQNIHGATVGITYVLYAPNGVTCANAGAGTTFVAELAAATSTAPGGAFTFPSNNTSTTDAGGFNVANWCLDGGTNGTQVAVSYDQR